MHNNELWLEQSPLFPDSGLSWNPDDYIQDDFGSHDYPDWFNPHGSYNYDASSSSLTPTSLVETDGLSDFQYRNKTSKRKNDIFSTSSQENEGINADKSSDRLAFLRWHDVMTDTAHSNFFGLDLGAGHAPELPDLTENLFDQPQAEERLQKWAEVAAHYSSNSPTEAFLPLGQDMILPTATELHQNCVPAPSTLSDSASIAGPSKRTFSSPASEADLPPPGRSGKVEKKTFHFVANSDKKTAARLRNTMTSRNLRQSKVSRIAELERELERQQAEVEMWKQRALESGWKADP